jgi:DNA-binding IclR family transcriptional regulator
MDGTCVNDFESSERAGIKVIAKAASILRSLKDQPEGLSLGQIAEHLRMPRSTVQRIVSALLRERLVMGANPEGGIRLGPELTALADAARFDLVKVLRPVLQELAEQTGETVDLAVLRGQEMIFVDQIPGPQRLRAVSFVGESFTLTNTANGKACLALMPLKQAENLARSELARLPAARDIASLLAELKVVRKAGIAFDLEEHSEGICAVGAAFQDFSGGFCAISVPTPSQRFGAQREMIALALTKAKKAIEARMPQ